MDLQDFPLRIKKVRTAILEIEASLLKAEAELARADSIMESTIAFDQSLKNEAQRKAAKCEMQSVPSYQSLLSDIQAVKRIKHLQEIELEYLRGLFSAAKLTYQRAIVEGSCE